VNISATNSSVQSLQPVQQQGTPPDPDKLTPEQQAEVQEMKARDREVRAHEQAHMAAGGQYVTHGATYSYEQGPDGQRYATGGEVGIDTSAESGDPEATIRKMQTVRAAALAPAEPSGQDLKVAAEAAQAASKARSELRDKESEEAKEESGEFIYNKSGDKSSSALGNVGEMLDLRA